MRTRHQIATRCRGKIPHLVVGERERGVLHERRGVPVVADGHRPGVHPEDRGGIRPRDPRSLRNQFLGIHFQLFNLSIF